MGRQTKEPGDKFTTAELMAAVRARFGAPEWGLLEQVRSNTGFGDARTADALAMNLYPSRGLEVHGIEAKASRGDLLRELKDPAKAERIARYCDRWWIVAGSEDFVKPGELPPTWGLLVPTNRRRAEGAMVLRQVVEAPKLEAAPLDRLFVAAMMRAMAEREKDAVPRASIQDEIGAAYERGLAAATERGNDDLARAERDLATLREAVKTFEDASGLSVRHGSAHAIGKAVALVRAGVLEVQRAELGKLLDKARGTVAMLEQHVGDIDATDARAAVAMLELTFREHRMAGGS